MPEDIVTTTYRNGALSITFESYETDTITDFAWSGANSDLLRVDALLANATSFAGTGAADAVAQGYIYWVQHGQPGQADFGTTVYIDRNGTALDWVNAPDLALADLQGVAASQLSSWHFVA